MLRARHHISGGLWGRCCGYCPRTTAPLPAPPPPEMLLVLLLAAAARPCLQAEPSILSSLYGYDDCIGSVDNFDTQARH